MIFFIGIIIGIGILILTEFGSDVCIWIVIRISNSASICIWIVIRISNSRSISIGIYNSKILYQIETWKIYFNNNIIIILCYSLIMNSE